MHSMNCEVHLFSTNSKEISLQDENYTWPNTFEDLNIECVIRKISSARCFEL